MKSLKMIFSGIAMSLLFLSGQLFAQADNKNEQINNQQKKDIISKAIARLKENYIFPERVDKIAAAINSRFDHQGYSGFNTLFDFLEELNKDLESSGNDHHLDIFYGPQYVKKIIAAANSPVKGDEKVPAEFIELVKYENYFIKKAERLDGNIGYLKFNKFEELQFAKESLASAMNLITNSSAIIIDLTQNGGGSAATVHFLLSYFLPDSTKLGVFKSRKKIESVELWTPKDALIKKIPRNTPLYILVNKSTSSAAESFAYCLQQTRRAIIVGEQTHGEANPGQRFVINDKLYMMIPTYVNVSAVTGTNWEGTGVVPDIKTSPGLAFATAMVESCRELSKDKRNGIYTWIAPEYEAQLHPQLLPDTLVNMAIGNYDEGKKIILENCSLYYVTAAGQRKMTYIGNRTFTMEGRNDYRIRFPESNSSTDFAEIQWNDGTSDKLKKVK